MQNGFHIPGFQITVSHAPDVFFADVGFTAANVRQFYRTVTGDKSQIHTRCPLRFRLLRQHKIRVTVQVEQPKLAHIS